MMVITNPASEQKYERPVLKLVLAMLISLVLSPSAVVAHLMVAQHGTLNILDGSVYMVLSLPVSAFESVDDDGDKRVSIQEFSRHRSDIIEIVSENIILADRDGPLAFMGIMISPVTPHDEPDAPADQIIVMGRFVLQTLAQDLRFTLRLYGIGEGEQTMEITATHKQTEQKEVFELSEARNASVIFASAVLSSE